MMQQRTLQVPHTQLPELREPQKVPHQRRQPEVQVQHTLRLQQQEAVLAALKTPAAPMEQTVQQTTMQVRVQQALRVQRTQQAQQVRQAQQTEPILPQVAQDQPEPPWELDQQELQETLTAVRLTNLF